jgi:hypothetical protein
MGNNTGYVYGSLAEREQYHERNSHGGRKAKIKNPKNRNKDRSRTDRSDRTNRTDKTGRMSNTGRTGRVGYNSQTGWNGRIAHNDTYEPSRDYSGDQPEDAEVLRARKAELRQTVTVNREILKKELNMRKNRRRVRIKYFFMTGVLFVVFVAMIYRYSMVIEINNLVAEQKTMLNGIKNKAGILKKDIGKETDLEKIRSLAEDRLNMQKPDTHQYIYINVPRKDHALLRADTTGRQGNEEKVSIRDSINNIIDRIWFVD